MCCVHLHTAVFLVTEILIVCTHHCVQIQKEAFGFGKSENERRIVLQDSFCIERGWCRNKFQTKKEKNLKKG